MIKSKLNGFVRASRVFATITIGALLSLALVHTAHAADSDKDKLYKFYERNCQKSSKQNEERCAKIEIQLFRDYAAGLDPDKINDPKQVLIHLKTMRAKYLDLDKRNQLLERRNKALKAQASQSCSVASQPENAIKKSAGLGYAPALGEASPDTTAPTQTLDIMSHIGTIQDGGFGSSLK